MVKVDLLNNKTVFLANCSGREGGYRWLDANPSNGDVFLTDRLPSKDVNFSGTLWRLESADPSGEGNVFNIKCLATPSNTQEVYLEASGSDGSVGLDDDGNGSDDNSKWIIELASDAGTNYYPQYPWGDGGGQKEFYTFYIKNFNNRLNQTLLYGNADTRLVELTDDTDFTGAHWLVLVPLFVTGS